MSRVKFHLHPYISLPQKFEHSACLGGFTELPEALSRYTDWALLRYQGSRGTGSSWRTSSQQGGVSERLGCPWRKSSLCCSLIHGSGVGGTLFIITKPRDQGYFWGCDVLLATPSVGRVSDVATIDDGSSVRLGDAIFPAKVLGVIALLLAENPQIN